jgi:hypothetical protein
MVNNINTDRISLYGSAAPSSFESNAKLDRHNSTNSGQRSKYTGEIRLLPEAYRAVKRRKTEED